VCDQQLRHDHVELLAARDLHERSNWHGHSTGIGIHQSYERQAKLLASLYLCHLVAGLLDEIAGLIEKAPHV
jgi:hypothetical protein